VVDNNVYECGVKVADVDFDAVNIEPHKFHGEWNYTISPQHTTKQPHPQT
jgi:hypothetical protein